MTNLLGVDFDPRVFKADLIRAGISAHCDQHLNNTDKRIHEAVQLLVLQW